MNGFSLKRIFAVWIGGICLGLLSLLIPHAQTNVWSGINNSIQLLLFVFCVYLFRSEPIQRNKYIFLNFAILFGFSIAFHLYNFIPAQDGYFRFFFFQYVGSGAYYFALTLAIAYVTVDLIFRELRTIQKYGIAIAIVGGFFVYYFNPYLSDPLHVYSTRDARDFVVLQKSFDQYDSQFGSPPSPELLAERVSLSKDGGAASEMLSQEELIGRVNDLYPYLLGEQNYRVLLVRPLYLNTIHMCVVCLGFILMFFAYQYVKDPPQGAYIDKIMFLFLVFCTMEILHAWSYAQSVEWQSFYEIMNLGQAISLSLLLFLGVFFSLRLNFVTSAKGEFYEQEIAARPTGDYALERCNG